MGVGEFIIWIIVLYIIFFIAKKTLRLIEYNMRVNQDLKKIQLHNEDDNFDFSKINNILK